VKAPFFKREFSPPCKPDPYLLIQKSIAMKTSTLRVIGGVQAIVFCAGLYLVVLFLSILVCSSVYRAVEENRALLTEDRPFSALATWVAQR